MIFAFMCMCLFRAFFQTSGSKKFLVLISNYSSDNGYYAWQIYFQLYTGQQVKYDLR